MSKLYESEQELLERLVNTNDKDLHGEVYVIDKYV